jgi:hypothetical protein
MAAVQPAINDLATQAAATVASLQSEAVQLTTQNAATQAELDKINPPTP